MALPPNVVYENWIKNQNKVIGNLNANTPSSGQAPSAVLNLNVPKPQSLTFPVSRLINNCQFNPVNFVGQFTLAANPKRTYLLIQNQGGVVLFVNFDGTAPPFTTGLNIPVGGVYEPFAPPTNQITFSGTGYLVEGTLQG